jgi:hypothetical protein
VAARPAGGQARRITIPGDRACRDDAELAYLVSLQLPVKGTVCNVDQLPFGLSPEP